MRVCVARIRRCDLHLLPQMLARPQALAQGRYFRTHHPPSVEQEQRRSEEVQRRCRPRPKNSRAQNRDHRAGRRQSDRGAQGRSPHRADRNRRQREKPQSGGDEDTNIVYRRMRSAAVRHGGLRDRDHQINSGPAQQNAHQQRHIVAPHQDAEASESGCRAQPDDRPAPAPLQSPKWLKRSSTHRRMRTAPPHRPRNSRVTDARLLLLLPCVAFSNGGGRGSSFDILRNCSRTAGVFICARAPAVASAPMSDECRNKDTATAARIANHRRP